MKTDPLNRRRMVIPSLCLFLVVNTLMVSAAPAASPSLPAPLKTSAPVTSLVKRETPATTFTCDKSGIFADQDTGCQVFHFCQDGGRMDSFFCPNLTLFNQRFFVCDWSYNVDCSTAHQYYHLNDGLYLQPSPEQITQALKPAIKISQVDILDGSASTQVLGPSPSSNLQLDAVYPAVVVDENTIEAEDDDSARIGKALPANQLITDSSIVDGLQDISLNTDAPAIVSDASNTVYYDDVADPEPIGYQSDPIVTVYSDDAADPEPLGYQSGDIVTVYSDDVADPEPLGYQSGDIVTVYSDDVADPEPVGYYDSVADPEPYNNYATYAGYDDASDPEPVPVAPVATYVNSPLPTYQSGAASAYYDNNAVDQTYYDDAADPEPSFDPYSQDGYILPTYQSSLIDSSDPEPSADPEYSPY